MQLLRRLAATTHMTELAGSTEIAKAEAYEVMGWVTLRRTRMSKGRSTRGQRTVYAFVTDAGRVAAGGLNRRSQRDYR